MFFFKTQRDPYTQLYTLVPRALPQQACAVAKSRSNSREGAGFPPRAARCGRGPPAGPHGSPTAAPGRIPKETGGVCDPGVTRGYQGLPGAYSESNHSKHTHANTRIARQRTPPLSLSVTARKNGLLRSRVSRKSPTSASRSSTSASCAPRAAASRAAASALAALAARSAASAAEARRSSHAH